MTTSGVGSTVAFGVESTWGTPVTTTRVLPMLSESLTKSTTRVRGRTLTGSRLLPDIADSRIGNFDCGGSTDFLLYNSGMGMLFEAMLGDDTITGAGPYTHTCTPAALPVGMTIGVGYAGDTSVPRKTLEGGLVESWEIAASVGELATCSINWVGEDIVFSNSASVAGTLPSGLTPFFYTESVIAVSEVGGSGITTTCVTDFRLSCSNSLETDLRCLGSSAINKPVATDLRAYECRLGIRFDSFTNVLHDAYIADTHVQVVNTFTNAASETLTITVQGKLAGETPVISGPEVIETTVPLEIESTTDALAITLVAVNSDATI